MTDTTLPDPGDAPMTTSPLLTTAAIPILQKFADDLRALCAQAYANGMTLAMILGEMQSAGWMFLDGAKDAALAGGAPTPSPPAQIPTAVTLTTTQGVTVTGKFTPGQSFIGAKAASNGTALIYADGSYSYTPAQGFVGTDTFSYTATDSAGAQTVVPVSVIVSV